MTDIDAELTGDLRAFRDMCREIAPELRDRALAVDADPLAMAEHLDSETLRLLRTACTPKRFRVEDVPAAADSYTASCLARAIGNLELGRGDAALLTANTGPSLAGLAVDALGDDAQQELFYRAIEDGRTWTFFAMTEPDRGSDATAITTRLDADPTGGYRLSGTKRYISNAVRGSIGVVFARTGGTALSIRGALVHRPRPGVAVEMLDMIGLRGACISELTLDDVEVPAEHLLGGHLPQSKRGIWGAGRAFNIMRVQIAAQALGVAFAVCDYVREHRPAAPGLDLLSARLDAARQLLYDVAIEVDNAPDDRRWPSVAKLHATDLAVRVTRAAAEALGPGSLLEHPLLEKWSRDVYALEFMDGTSNILRLSIAPNLTPSGLSS
ncbi:MAG TPA: acyl-CoA dehydrogenase family protein [Actinokineospora sp.]|jgi:alkylation response protein AidB-like acyl-CoA dehydrogenase|nr:acyl-CoA dehydrogenase family protein [Actinokineospora sp.]